MSAEPPSATPPREWIEPATGHRVVRLSTEAGTRSMYFHQNSITPDGRYVITEAHGGHRRHRDRDAKKRTDRPGQGAGAVRRPQIRARVFLAQRRRRRLRATHRQPPSSRCRQRGGEPRRIAQIERGFIGSVNADETLLLGVYAERAYQLEQGPRDPRFDANYAATGKDGKPLTFAEAKEVRLLQREQARIPMAMFTVNTATGEQKIIHRPPTG